MKTKKENFEKQITEFEKSWNHKQPPTASVLNLELLVQHNNGTIENLTFDSQAIDLSIMGRLNLPPKQLITFKRVLFKGGCSFTNYCAYRLQFTECLFQDETSFHLRFDGGIAFALNIFQKEVHFINSEFRSGVSAFGDAGLYMCTFQSGAKFKNCTFHDFGAFTYNHFHGHSYFQDVIFKSHLLFESNTFHAGIELRNTQFLGGVQVIDNIFTKDMLKLPFSAEFFSKLEMTLQDQGQTYEAFKFYALQKRSKNLNELRVKLSLSPSKIKKFIRYLNHIYSLSTLYYILSNYGNSLARPFFSFLSSTLTFSVLYFIYQAVEISIESQNTNWMQISSDCEGIQNSLILSIKGFVAPIYKFESIRPQSGIGVLFYIVNTSFQFLTFGFFAVAVRRMFKS